MNYELKSYLGVQISRHKATFARERLVRGQTLHVGVLQQAGQILGQVGQGGVHGHLHSALI